MIDRLTSVFFLLVCMYWSSRHILAIAKQNARQETVQQISKGKKEKKRWFEKASNG